MNTKWCPVCYGPCVSLLRQSLSLENSKVIEMHQPLLQSWTHWGWLQPLLRLRGLWLGLMVAKLQKDSVFVLLSAGKEPCRLWMRLRGAPCTSQGAYMVVCIWFPAGILSPSSFQHTVVPHHGQQLHLLSCTQIPLITSGPQTDLGDVFSDNSYVREELWGWVPQGPDTWLEKLRNHKTIKVEARSVRP